MSELSQPGRFSGRLAGRKQRLGQRRVGHRGPVAHRLIEGQEAAGEQAVIGARGPAGAFDCNAGHLIAPRGRRGRRGGVGDKRCARAGRRADQLEGERMDVHAVGYQRDVETPIDERDAGESGRLMVQGGHRVEDVRDKPRAGVDRGVCDLAAGAGVSERNGDAAFAEPGYELERPGQLGGDRDEPHRRMLDPVRYPVRR